MSKGVSRTSGETRILRYFLVAVVLLGGQAQVSIASPLDDLFKSVSNAIPFNPFDTKGNEFNKLVDSGENAKAEAFFDENYAAYFDERFNRSKNDVTPQLVKLARWTFEKNYSEQNSTLMTRLQGIVQLKKKDGDLWRDAKITLTEAASQIVKIDANKLLITSRLEQAYQSELQTEVERGVNVVRRDRQEALKSTFDEVLRTGIVDASYPTPFQESEYLSSDEFQERVYTLLSQTDQLETVKHLAPLTASSTSKRFARESKLKTTLAKLGKGPYTFENLGDLRNIVKEFGKDSGLEGAVKIGYFDLTASSFKDRNVFDFELAFDKDYGLELQDAKESVLGRGSISAYDFIFVTDLSAAKILREFKNKREVDSLIQTGTREEPNPGYVSALSEYQTAMSTMQSTKMQNAASASQPCYGSAIQCVLLGALKGVSDSGAENNFKQKSEALSRTSQTVTRPVHSKYKYQLVDIAAAKLARVDYYVIDVRKKQIYSNYLEIKDAEKFTVSYNVEDTDPDKSSILGKNQREEDLTAWEKRPIAVKLSTLFEPTNIAQNPAKPFTTVEAFLKPLSSRQYAAASATYAPSTPTKSDTRGVSNTASASTLLASSAKTELKPASTRSDSGAIADERFDSVLIVKTSKAIGTGFYVTPDLVLTAFHVVDGSNLVELTFYDGTKTFGKVIDSDVRLDLALIKPQVPGKPVKIHTGQIRLGETAEAIGHPKGYEFTITRGVVSALRKQAGNVLKSGPPLEFVQTDTPISPGNSGGPLFIRDVVIGVNDWIRVDKGSQNLNFSVSYNEIRDYLNRFEGKSK